MHFGSITFSFYTQILLNEEFFFQPTKNIKNMNLVFILGKQYTEKYNRGFYIHGMYQEQIGLYK